MPTVNIPPLVRFFLYLVGALALLFVSYAVDKTWAGDAEVRLVTGVCALLNLLAAAKTNLSDTDGPSAVGKAVADAINGAAVTGRAGRAPRRDQGTFTIDDAFKLALLVLVVVVIVLLVTGTIDIRGR